MTETELLKLKVHSNLIALFEKNKNYFDNTLLKKIRKFRISNITLIILRQHETIIRIGIDRNVPGMKESLCTLVYEIAVILHSMKVRSLRKDGAFRQPLPVNKLILRRDDSLIRYCRSVFRLAELHTEKLKKIGVNYQAILALSKATDMYNVVVPPPRTTILLAEKCRKDIETLFHLQDKLLEKEIGPMLNNYSHKVSGLIEKYNKIINNRMDCE